jgi:drug/metabolite transporter (DMT)-like permease
MSAENIIFRELLYSYTPVALYAIRTFILACFFMAYYSPRYRQVSARHWWLIAGSAFLGVIGMVGKLYAFSEIGVIYTTLIGLLAPLLVFFASWGVFHERMRARIVVAALVILVVVSWATVLTFT